MKPGQSIKRHIICRFFFWFFFLLLYLPLSAQNDGAEADAANPTKPKAGAQDNGASPPPNAKAGAQDGGGEDAIRLPQAEITVKKDSSEYVTQDEMERSGAQDLWEALRRLPGVIQAGGGGMRNESNVTVRGMDERMMPAFIDGIPLTAPYRGEADDARFLSADLEDIEIQKGYSSLLLGDSMLGGALIMRSAMPRAPFEAFYKTSAEFDGIFKYASFFNATGIGTRQEHFYAKTVFQLRDRDHYRLPQKYTPDPLNIQQKGDRVFSDSRDLKLTILAGWTPRADVSLNASYVLIDSDKGVSPEETQGAQTTFNVWTLWQKQTFSLNAIYEGASLFAKALFYLDKFDNTLAVASSIHNVEIENYENPSRYDDYSAGLRLEERYTFNEKNILSAAFNVKQDGHKDNKDGTRTKEISEITFSLGSEYEYKPFNALTLRASLGISCFTPLFLYSINELTQSDAAFLWQAQGAFFFDITPNHTLRITTAKKNHIPTMRMRYSETVIQGSGTVIPNPGLKPEEALNNELGYQGTFVLNGRPFLNCGASVYCNYIYNMLAEEMIGGAIHRINADSSVYYGFEAGIKFFANDFLYAGAAFTIARYAIKYSIEGHNAIGNYPQFSCNFYAVLTPFAHVPYKKLTGFSIMPQVEYEGARYGSQRMINVNAANVLNAFTLVSLKLNYRLNESCSFSFMARNLFDELYYLQNNALPMGGRSFRFDFAWKL
jgi:iron complex outermembrane receptor protein